MKNNFQSKAVPRGTRTIWRYLSALFLLFTFAIGNVWGAETTIFSASCKVSSDVTVTKGTTDQAVTSAQADVTGGSLYVSNGETSDKKLLLASAGPSGNKKAAFTITNGKTIFKIVLTQALQAGDVISSSFNVGSDKDGDDGLWFSTSSSRPSSEPATKAVKTTPSGWNEVSYTVATSDGICGETTFYVHRATGTSTYFPSLTITRSSGGGGDTEAPTLSNSTPANEATDVAVSGTIVLTFSENIASVDDTKFSLSGATIGTVAIDGSDATKVNVPYSSAANSATVTLSVAAEAVADAAGNKSAALDDIAFTTVAAETPACPSGLTISGTKDYTAGQTISLEAALEAGNGEITYTWYKGSIAAGNEVGTGATFTKANCVAGDAGDYFCVASKDACANAESAAYPVTVAPVSYCAELYPATSGASPTAANQEIILQTEAPNASYGGKIFTHSKKSTNTWEETFTYTSKGLQLNKSGDDKVRVELNHLLAENTVITVNMDWTRSDDKSSGVILRTGDDSQSVKTMTKKNPSGDFSDSYTIQSTDTKLIGSNSFILARSNSIGIKSITVSNCGAELHALTSAIDPVAAEGKATISLSKSLIAEGATATAEYSITDPTAYDFDEWQISGATIDDAKANPVTITMGATDAVITLKLKEASVKHTVTYYDGEAIPENKLDEELVEHNAHPTAAEIVVPHKLGYTFAGWSTTNGGAVVPLNTISVAADMPLFAVFNEVNCSAQSGTIFSVILNKPQAENCTIRSGSGYETEADLIKYGTVSGGIALAKNSSTSNHIVITEDPKLRLLGGNGKVHIQFDCALQEGDKIRTTIENQNIAYTTSDSRSTTNYFEKGTAKELTITKDHVLENASEIYLWSASSSDGKLISLEVIRPEKFAVTFNMHGHGDAVVTQNIVSGGKVSEPADPTATGWDFGGWYKTYVAEPESYSDAWDFENDVVSAATELHAKWTEHVASSDATLGSLSVNGEAITIVPSQTVYAVELPMGTTATPTVTATANDENVKAFTITQATAVDGSATIYVKAEDNTTEATYTINFSVATSKDIELVWDKSKQRCDATTPDANVLIAAMSQYLSASYTGSAEEGGSLTTGKTTGSKIIITAKPGYAFKAMGFYGKIQDGTCNFYNDGVVETIGTSTGDACYADVFSNDEVHEFIIELTGTNGVYIRNMQLTIIEACTPITLAWNEEPVEFEVGKAGYAIAATANNGGTVSYSTTASEVVDVVAATGELTISGLGSATLKAATAEGDGTTYCANGGNDIEISKAVNTYYLVKFDAQNGDAADEVKYYDGDAAIALPVDPTFAGYDFQGWFDAETGGNKYTAAITPTASTTVYAQWVAQCAGATITTQPTGASYLTGRTPVALVCEATAGNGGELTYEWFTCDDEYKANPVAATATPSTAVAGTFYYFCKVTEAGCAVEAFSDVVTITVADKDAICIIKSTPTSATEATVDGVYQGNAYFKGRESGKKLNSKYDYVAVQLKDGFTFLATDKVVVNQTADLSSGDISKFYIFTEVPADGKSYVTVNNASPLKGDNWFAMPAEMEGESALYIGRVDANCNPSVGYLAVYRACAPILSKVTVNGVDGTPDNTNHVSIEVPFTTTQSQLEAIAYEWVSNNDAWTADPANAPVAANAWEFGVENTVTFTDKDGDASEYYITISKAAASSDATLSALTVNGQAISLEGGVFEYSFELPYGTTTTPTVVATPNHVAAVATVDPCTLSGATITVVPESGAGDQQVYTLTFSISKWKEIVIWDGSYMSAVKTVQTEDIASWEAVGFTGVESWSYATDEPAGKVPAYCSDNDKTYTHVNGSGKNECNIFRTGGNTKNSRYFKITVPKDYVAKFYVVYGSHGEGTEVTMSIGNEASATASDGILSLTTDHRYLLSGGISEIVGAGDYYLNATASADFFEIRAYLRPGHARTAMLGNGVLGTVCVPNNVAIEDIQGATFYELQGRDYTNYGKLAFDEIISGGLEAGVPYVFLAHGDKLVLFYGETSVGAPVDKHNGMYGTFETIVLTDLTDVYYFAQRALWSCDGAVDLTIAANRAYVKLNEIDPVSSPSPAPGRRRILMGVNGETQAQGFENLDASEKPLKVMIDGTLYIIRGEKVFDATGRLVK